MAKIFISFLGLGNPSKQFGYDQAKYNWPGKSEEVVAVRFAQTAILKFLEVPANTVGRVDKVVFLCTEDSKKRLPLLEEELRQNLGYIPAYLVPEPLVPTEMTAINQWSWFEQILGIIGYNDRLIIDFTHGMRAVPIVFSSAIGFLQRAKRVNLVHALYAWYDQNNNNKVHPIVDMRDFYVINDWAESVARLTDDADARKLGEMAKSTGIEALKPLTDDGLINAFQEMTDCIRNVDVNNVAAKVSEALTRVEQAREKSSGSAKVMLDLVWEKFSILSADYPPSGRYDSPYFENQLRIIEVLLEHRLYMQAFTAMRELVGSLGMAGVSGKYKKQMFGSDGRKYRLRFAEIFVNMLQYPPDEWKFHNHAAMDKEILLPWFESLRQISVEPELRNIVKPMVDIRNGFDHAWTSKAQAQPVLEEKGREYFKVLQTIINQLSDKQLLI